MNIIQQLRHQAGITQQELANAGGTSQSTIAAYESGSKSPTLRTVENLARSQNLEFRVDFKSPMTREDLRSLAFHRAIADLLREDPEFIVRRARGNLAKLASMHPDAGTLFDKWREWLSFPPTILIDKILDQQQENCEMRQVSPFSGLLNAQQRTQVLHGFREEYLA
ncbi:MAG: helix-turn-helix transcriptional regulator [Gammaproteobacteria bacterium]|nr:helix-turn-helix transcriptional regulator [Gammaproteobacteria bacterium]